jgi:predicted Zn-dependent protease
MRYLIKTLTSTLIGIILCGNANGQFTTSKSEIERASRIDWLRAKVNNVRPENDEIQTFVECIADQLIKVLPEEFDGLDWEIIVFEDEAPNAYALIGGKIGVNTGIFTVAETPDALAAVIGHEIAHLTENHVFERAQRHLTGEAIGIIGSAITRLPSTTRTATALAFTLPFSRSQETDADIKGLHYMALAGFDPRSTMNLWKNMSAQGDSQRSDFASTHPSDSRRLTDLVLNMTDSLVTLSKTEKKADSCIRN